jgi:hypothetical protein
MAIAHRVHAAKKLGKFASEYSSIADLVSNGAETSTDFE